MRNFKFPVVALFLLGVFAARFCLADIYMHNPRGSNDRNCERNVNRNNANRLFDSENNAQGGYACPRAVGGPETVTPTMYYFVGSKLVIEWTNQHGCGVDNGKVHCDVILQYMCGPDVRDGTPKDAQDAATDTVPFDPKDPSKSKDQRFGLHEGYDYYKKCWTRSRNLGLFAADQKIRPLSAVGTRQNPNGNRHGLECPEERDHFPYWHPTPWKDIAIITDDISRCQYYKTQSQNVIDKGECIHKNGPALGEGPRANRWYNNQAACESVDPLRKDNDKDKVQQWVPSGKWGIAAPDCVAGDWTRVNHLGNTKSGQASRYIWTIPDDPNPRCVLRIRYNVSTYDYPQNDFGPNAAKTFVDSSSNGDNSPVKQDPYLDIGGKRYLSLALNTNQYGRTFQDRSYAFSIRSRPNNLANANIFNLNVRGKRGNIVQTFPAVEYDFVPNDLTVKKGDYIHIQWTGSDYNPRRGCNDAEGGPPDKLDNDPKQNPRADRSNLVQTSSLGVNFPMNATERAKNSMFVKPNGDIDENLAYKLAFLGQTNCLTLEELAAITNKNEREFTVRNCFKLNAVATPYFDAGPVQMNKVGTFTYYCSRNTNFSNRDQKGIIRVTSGRREIDEEMMISEEEMKKRTIVPRQAISNDTAIIPDNTTTVDDGTAAENDARGSGDKYPCGYKPMTEQETDSGDGDGVSSGGAAILAFAMLFVGFVLGSAIVGGVVAGVYYYKKRSHDYARMNNDLAQHLVE